MRRRVVIKNRLSMLYTFLILALAFSFPHWAYPSTTIISQCAEMEQDYIMLQTERRDLQFLLDTGMLSDEKSDKLSARIERVELLMKVLQYRFKGECLYDN